MNDACNVNPGDLINLDLEFLRSAQTDLDRSASLLRFSLFEQHLAAGCGLLSGRAWFRCCSQVVLLANREYDRYMNMLALSVMHDAIVSSDRSYVLAVSNVGLSTGMRGQWLSTDVVKVLSRS